MKLSDIDDLQRARVEFQNIVNFEKTLREWTGGTGRIEILVKDENDCSGVSLNMKNQRHVNLVEMREDLRLLAKKYRERVQSKLVLMGVDDFAGWLPKE